MALVVDLICLNVYKDCVKDCALAAQMTNVTVEGCTEIGIKTRAGASVELTGCTLRDNKVDYRRDSKSSIVVDGSARPEGDS